MGNFVCGMLVEDDRVMWRHLDLMALEMSWHLQLPMKRIFKDLLLGERGCVSCEAALATLQDLKVAIAAYEELFEHIKGITPEWLEEHSEELHNAKKRLY